MKWLLIDDSPKSNQTSMTITQIAEELSSQGDEVLKVNSFFAGKQVPSEEIATVLANENPDAIMFQSCAGLRFYDVVGPCSCPCINLWFDDPLMRVGSAGLHEKMKESSMLFHHFIWDGYWRDRTSEIWRLNSNPIHLAASKRDFYEASTIFNKDDIVFIGNLHSPRSIKLKLEVLPPTFQRMAAFCESFLRTLPDTIEIPSWDQLLHMAECDSLKGERRLLKAQIDRDCVLLGELQWCIWAMSKNMARIRILQRALKVGSVRMFADTIQLSHANESETRGVLGEWSSRLNFHATDGLQSNQLGELYHHGWIHIQATDPQSVQGGIPYRVFQTAASGRPLLTDKKKELGEAFEYGKEILAYDDPIDFEDQLAMACHIKSDLRDIGQAARKRFEKEHTWAHRIEYIKKSVGIGFGHKVDLSPVTV